MGHRCWRPMPQTNFTRTRGSLFHWEHNSWFDLETCYKVIGDGAIEQNTYDFLLVFYSDFDRISYRFCATVNFMPKTLVGDCDL